MGSMGGQTEAVAPLQGSDEPQQVHQEHQPPTRATYPEAPHGDATEDEFLSGAGGVKRPAEPLLEEDMPNGLVKVPRVDEGPQDMEEDDDGDDGELATTADQAADFDPFQEPSKPTGGMSHGRWTREEHERFLTGLQMYGRAWRTISKCVVKTRTPEQVRIHAQKYFHKQAQKAKNKHTHDGHWTNEEHELFLDLYDQHGNKWKKIAEIMKTRTNEQVRTHAQKYFAKLSELRDRGYDGQYNMDGKRHLTKSFLQQPGVPAPRPATPPAAASAQAKHWTKQPPGAKRSSGQRKRPGRRRRDDDDDDDVIDDDEDDDTGAATPARSRASTGSSKRTPPPDGPRLVTVSTRSGRKATTRKWDEELQDDEDEMDEDDVYQVGAKKGPPMNGGGGGAPKADGGDSDDDVIEEEEVEEEEQDDKAAETLLFWQQSQTSGPDSVDGSLTTAPGEEGPGSGSSAAPTGPGEAMPTTTSATSNGMTPQMMMMQPQQLMPLPTPAPQEQCQQQQPVMVMPPLPPHMAPMQPLDTQHHQTIAEQVMMMMPPTPVAYHDPHHSHHQQQQPQPGGPGEMPSAVQDLMPDPLPSPSAMLQQHQHMPPMPHEAMDATALHHHHHQQQQLMEVPVEQPTMVEVPPYGKDVPEVAALPPQHQQQEQQQQQLRVEDEEPAPDSPQSVHELEGAQALLSWQG